MKMIYTIVGMRHRFPEAEAIVRALVPGTEITLIREPDNEHDPNAIQVWVGGRHVAYLRAAEIKELASYIDAHGAPPLGGVPPGGFSIEARRAATPYPMVEVEEVKQ